MREKRQNNMSSHSLRSLAIILGFTLAFFTAGCMAGGLVKLLGAKTVDLAGLSGIFGLAGFFTGAVFLMRL